MTYLAMIKEAIASIGDRTGSSRPAIKAAMFAQNKGLAATFKNHVFLAALRSGVAKGELVQVKASFKISAGEKAKRKRKTTPKKKAAPKKKTATKKKATKKTTKKRTTKKATKKTTKKTAGKKKTKKTTKKSKK